MSTRRIRGAVVRYFISFEEGGEPTEQIAFPRSTSRLPVEETADSIALACRSAALSFMDGVAHGWSKFDLAMWLAGPYAHATRFAPRGERTLPDRPTQNGPESDPLGGERLHEVMDNARMHSLALCEELSLPRSDSDFIDDAIARGLLTPIEDHRGSLLWVPVDAARMRLCDRVRSLFVVDYLLAPHLYLESLLVCQRCERIVFDINAKQVGHCSLHRHRSGIVVSGHGSQAESEDASGQDAGYAESTFGQAG